MITIYTFGPMDGNFSVLSLSWLVLILLNPDRLYICILLSKSKLLINRSLQKIWQLRQEKSMSTITSSTGLWRSSSRVLVIPRGVHRNFLSSSTRKPQEGFPANPSLLSLSIGQRSSALSRSNGRMYVSFWISWALRKSYFLEDRARTNCYYLHFSWCRNRIICNVSGVPTPPGAPSHSW